MQWIGSFRSFAHWHPRASLTSLTIRARWWFSLKRPRKVRPGMSLSGPSFFRTRFTTSEACHSGTSWPTNATLSSTRCMLGNSFTTASKASRCSSSSLAVNGPGIPLMRIMKPILRMSLLALRDKVSRSVLWIMAISIVCGKWNGKVE